MMCPRCHKNGIIHNIKPVQSVECILCGYLEYTGFPPRTIDQDEQIVKKDMARIRAELIESGLIIPDEPVKYCARCQEVEIEATKTFCPACLVLNRREAVARWQKTHPEQTLKNQRRSQERRTAKRRAQRMSAVG